MAKLTKSVIIGLIKEAIDEEMNKEEEELDEGGCPGMSMDDGFAGEPMGEPMEPMDMEPADQSTEAKLDALMGMMGMLLDKLDDGMMDDDEMMDDKDMGMEPMMEGITKEVSSGDLMKLIQESVEGFLSES